MTTSLFLRVFLAITGVGSSRTSALITESPSRYIAKGILTGRRSVAVVAFEEALELHDAFVAAHFLQSLGLDLANAFARDLEASPHFVERARIAIEQAKAEFQDFSLALGQRGKDIFEVALEHREARPDRRIFGARILNKVTKIRFLAITNGSLE